MKNISRVRLVIALSLALILAFGITLSVLPEAAEAQTSGCVTYHIVQYGENLYRIGLAYGVPYTVIATVNGISNPHLIYTGQSLCIPAATTTYATTGMTYGTVPQYAYQTVPQQTTGYVPGTLNVPPNLDVIASLPFYYPIVEPPGGDPGHQINFWPEYGGRYSSHSIMREPGITIWTPCVPESVIYEQFLVCSKTGLGYFYDFNLVDPATLTTTTTIAPTPTP